ncbi:MAG: 4-hydroxythreonine-4-phosphate dehydrogenase PdxA [Burkholderiales bacterium]|nr:4-hydroxythreonine-4-phosphate dehydrogenase PdxA [Burkholderiales bacterium]
MGASAAVRPARHASRPVAVTAGEPAGIGPELCLALARAGLASRIVVVGDRELLRERARRLRIAVPIVDFDPARPRGGGRGALRVRHVALAAPAAPGRLDPANSRAVLDALEAAARGCRDGIFAAMATAPLHKGVINDAGIAFTGHTEYLARLTGARHVVMMLVGGGMRVALATTHVALAEVPRRITATALGRSLEVLLAELARRFGLPRPRVAVAGLNPHAGESGYLGREEIEVIAPLLARWRARGHRVMGPLPADTLFVPEQLKRYDCVLAMYHDQGLPVLKHAAFGGGVNVTLGLPFVRTSVDHGTALELAGTGKAHAGSLIEAVRLAARLARPRPGRAAT